jgi:sugar phosphate isomerase/epimerase
LQGGPAGSSPGGWQPHFSASSLLFRELSLEDACARIAELGFAAVDIWSAYENCPHLDSALNELGPAGLKSILQRHRLQLGSFSTYVGGYAKYARLLGQAGGGLAIQGSAGPCDPSQLTRSMRQFLEELKPLLSLAEQHDSYLAIENHEHSLLSSLDSIKAFVELNASPRLGIALAPYHLQAIQASVPAAIELCGAQLFFFYAWQKADGVAQLPGIGPTDFAPWLKALAKIRYSRYLNPFMHGHVAGEERTAALKKAKDHLAKIAAGLAASSP